jgi:hypothetical protein
MQDYGDMVRQLMMRAQRVGDVVPFGKRSMYPGMGTEGGGRMGTGGGSRGEVAPLRGRRGELEKELERGEITPQQYQQIMAVRQAVSEAGPPSSKAIWDKMGQAERYQAMQEIQAGRIPKPEWMD